MKEWGEIIELLGVCKTKQKELHLSTMYSN